MNVMVKRVSGVNKVTAVNMKGKSWVRKNIEACIRTLFPGRRKVQQIPVYELSSWGATMESCLDLPKETRAAVREVFYTFDEETQRALTFSPTERGEWIARARFWAYTLKPTLSKEHYHIAISAILKWYIHCVKNLRTMEQGR